jgi:hypothetical protein
VSLRGLLVAVVLAGLSGALAGGGAAQPAPDRVEVEVGATGTTGSTVPFWLHAGTDGTIGAASSGGRLRLRAERTVASEGTWAVGYGAEFVGRASARETAFFPALYATGRYRFLELRVGRQAETIGTVAEGLTSGSLGQSRNATPIPKVVLATDGYTAVPFTRRWLEFKGRYADGLLPDGRFAEGAYLHQKTFYLRAGTPSPVQVYGGLVHNAMWGGTAPDVGRLPQSLNDYARTVVALSGAEDAPRTDRIYIQGDHFGVIDVGLNAEVGPVRARAYRQFVYEDRDNLKFKSPQDGLFGLALSDTRTDRVVDRLAYEHLYTKWQNGPVGPNPDDPRGGPGGRDDYYNHSIYESGWMLYGRTAGSPLLTPFGRGDGRIGIANNRVVGHHLGVAGHLGPLDYRALATYTRNYGTYDDREWALEETGTYRFEPPLEQVSVLLEAQMPWPGAPAFEAQAALGLDAGGLYDGSVGAQVGLVYRPLARR